MQPVPSLIAMQFLAWVAERPRSYAEAMAAWRTSCPRLSVWEDSLLDGLIEVVGVEQKSVRLTAAGRAALDAGGHVKPAPP